MGIAAFARAFGIDHEVAKSRDLDLLPFFEMSFDNLKNRFHDVGRLFFREADFFIDTLHNIRLGHTNTSAVTTTSSHLHPYLNAKRLHKVVNDLSVQGVDLGRRQRAICGPIQD